MSRFWYRDLSTRFEHAWIIAPPKSGKTQLLQSMIAWDLPAARDGKASIVVIDSQGPMIETLKHLAIFNHIPLRIIDPAYDVSANPFAISGTDDNANFMLNYIIGALYDAPMTSKQSGMFQWVLRGLTQTGGATIRLLMQVLLGHRLDTTNFDDDTREYFENSFYRDTSLNDTKEQVGWRIRNMLSNATVARMFSQERNDLDFTPIFDSPGVTLIYTNKKLLKSAGTELFGRICIAQILLASQAREGRGLNSFVYVDECQDYIKSDPHMPELLDQARKQNIGFILAHQRLNQMKGDVYDALCNDAGMIMASRLRECGSLPKYMECSEDDLRRTKVGEFMCFIRDQRPYKAQSITVPGFVLEKMPKRTYTPPPPRAATPEPPRASPPPSAPPPAPSPSRPTGKRPQPSQKDEATASRER
jgi:hypothetical protein